MKNPTSEIEPLAPLHTHERASRCWAAARAGRLHALRAALLATILVFFAPGSEAKEPDPPKVTMQSVFEQMKSLIPLSFDEEKWSDPNNQAHVLAALDKLERASHRLEQHGREREEGFDEIAINLGRDFREAANYYRIGAFGEARFFLTGSLQSCVACHVRLPTDASFPLADQLTDQIEIRALDPADRAWLFVTVRRFDEAMAIWEALLRDTGTLPSQLDTSGVLTDYLNVAIRVRADLPRVEKTLRAFSQRKDLPVYLEQHVAAWLTSIERLKADGFSAKQTPSLESGERYAKQAGMLAEGPFGREGLIADLASASLLVRWLEADRAERRKTTRNSTPEEKLARARAYYWLATVEARSFDGFWVNLSERHFESAIRSAPESPLARLAYARLEEKQILGFGGASGEYLPADVWNHLRELRELIGVEDAIELNEES